MQTNLQVAQLEEVNILEMPPPKTKKEIRGFLGKLQYMSSSRVHSIFPIWMISAL
jgi:hypothetical protein